MTEKKSENKDWWEVDPEVMTLQQLQAASMALRGRLDQYQQLITPLNNAYTRVAALIADQMQVPLAGIPAISNIPDWPADFVQHADWTVDEDPAVDPTPVKN